MNIKAGLSEGENIIFIEVLQGTHFENPQLFTYSVLRNMSYHQLKNCHCTVLCV